MPAKKSSSSSLMPRGMALGKHTLASLHARILVEKGERSPKVLLRATGASRATVFRLLSGRKPSGSAAEAKKIGRPRTLDPLALDSLKRMATRTPTLSNPQLARRLRDKGHPRVHPRTIGRALIAIGLQRAFPIKKPLLTERHKRIRLAWCLKNRDRDWTKVIFTDESTLLFAPYRQKILFKKGNPRPMVGSVKYPPSLMIWGGISVRGATPICPIKGKINQWKYQDVLMDYLIPSMNVLYPDGFVLQQDNATSHVANSTIKFLELNGIEVMDWPPCSPDLSPIENLWANIKKLFAPEKRTTIHEWRERVSQIWDAIPIEHLGNLINSMPDRIEACISARGGVINY